MRLARTTDKVGMNTPRLSQPSAEEKKWSFNSTLVPITTYTVAFGEF
jgi:hypothetical protein